MKINTAVLSPNCHESEREKILQRYPSTFPCIKASNISQFNGSMFQSFKTSTLTLQSFSALVLQLNALRFQSMLQCINALRLQCFSGSIFNTLIPKHFNAPMRQLFNASMLQRFNASTLQCFNSSML